MMLKLPKCLLETILNLTAPAAYWVLDSLKEGSITVYYGGIEFPLKDLVYRDDISYQAASKVMVYFWGGPPTRLNWYYASLQVLVADRLLDYLLNHSESELLKCLGVQECCQDSVKTHDTSYLVSQPLDASTTSATSLTLAEI